MENKIIDRIRKFRALAASNNSPEEAAQAAAYAADLMFKHQIEETDLDVAPRVVEEVVDEAVASAEGKREVWKSHLAYQLALAFGCKMYVDRSRGKANYQVFGLKSAVQTISYMFNALVSDINRLTDAAWMVEKVISGGSSSPITWKNSFRLGAVNTITKRLQEQRKGQDAQVAAMAAAARAAKTVTKQSTALVAFQTDQERVEDGYKALYKAKGLRKGKASYRRHSKTAYERGEAAGANVGLGGGKALRSPSKQVRS